MPDYVLSRMWCHDCRCSFEARMDMSLNGNHEIQCPHCSHVHYRVVIDGIVTDTRYRSSMPTIIVTVSLTISSASNSFTQTAWANTTSSYTWP